MSQMPTPPLDMVMPVLANNAYIVVTYVLLALTAVALAIDARRRGSMLGLMCLAGGALAVFLEATLDVLCLVWYPAIDHEPLYSAFNYEIPYWMLPAYALYMGAQGYWMFRQFKAGLTRARLWTLFFVFWGTNAIVELPGLNLGIYTYYGDQPFRVFGFPLWMAMTNSLTPILVGVAVFGLHKLLDGARVLLVVPLVPMVIVAGEAAAGWPIWFALNSGLGYAATYPAALVTLGLSLMTVYLVGRAACADTSLCAPRGVATAAV